MTYDFETWSLSNTQLEKLVTAHNEKAGTDGRTTWRGDVTIDGQSESQNEYPVDIKDLEADQEQNDETIWSNM